MISAAVAASTPLTLNTAIERALASNHELRALHHRTEHAEARIDTAGRLPDPRAQLTYFGESVQTRTGPQEAIYSLSQTLPWFEKLRLLKTQATLDAEASSLLYQEARLRLKEAVTRNFTEAAYLEMAVESTRQHLNWLKDARAILEEQVRGGATLNALLRLELESETARDRLDGYTQALHSERSRLAALLAVDEHLLEPLGKLNTPQAVPPPVQTAQTRLLKHNPALLALRRQVDHAEAGTRLSELDRYPDITLGINYIQIGNDGAPVPDAGRDPWNVSIAVNLPIWESKNRAAIRAAKSTERSTEQNYLQHLQTLKAELGAALNRQLDNERRSERYRNTLIPLAEQALENSQTAYTNGQITVLEMIDSERALLDLRLRYWRTIAYLHQDQATIDALTGQP